MGQEVVGQVEKKKRGKNVNIMSTNALHTSSLL